MMTAGRPYNDVCIFNINFSMTSSDVVLTKNAHNKEVFLKAGDG
jgi:hypothetical protein